MQRWKLVAVVAAVVVAVVASIVVLLVTATNPPPATAPTPVATVGPRVPRPTSAPTPTPTPHNENRPAGGDQANQVKVCNAYLDAFLQPGTEDERAARLREWATPQNLEQARATDPRRLSTARRKDDCALDPSNARPNQVQAHAQLTDGTWWSLTLVKDLTVAAQWRVHAVTREGH